MFQIRNLRVCLERHICTHRYFVKRRYSSKTVHLTDRYIHNQTTLTVCPLTRLISNLFTKTILEQYNAVIISSYPLRLNQKIQIALISASGYYITKQEIAYGSLLLESDRSVAQFLTWSMYLVYTNLFQFDCETSNVCLCKSRSNPFLEPTSTKQ